MSSNVTALPARAAQAQARAQLVHATLELMRARYSDVQFGLPQAAAQLYVSPRQLQRAFARHSTKPFRAHLTQMRVRQAARLLVEHPRMSVADVTAAVGYRQPAHFAKAFRAHYGMSPRRYRQAARHAAVQLPDAA